MTVGSRKGRIWTKGTHCKIPAHALFRQRSERKALLTAICNLEFIFGLCVLKVIMSNTKILCRYLQGEADDVRSPLVEMPTWPFRPYAGIGVKSFNSIWQRASVMGLKMKKWLTNSQFELWEARAPRQTPSGCLQALVDEQAQRQTQLTPESYHRINTYYVSIDKVLSELELRFSRNDQEILCALANFCHSETPDKESSSCVAKFYKLDGEILEAEQKMYPTPISRTLSTKILLALRFELTEIFS